MKKDKMMEGSPKEEMSESPAMEAKEAPGEHELDMHMNDLMKAHKIQSNKDLMPHVAKHMAKHAKAMSAMAGDMAPSNAPASSMDDLKAKKKKMFAPKE